MMLNFFKKKKNIIRSTCTTMQTKRSIRMINKTKTSTLRGLRGHHISVRRLPAKESSPESKKKKFKKKMSMVNPNVVVDDAVNLNSPKKNINYYQEDSLTPFGSKKKKNSININKTTTTTLRPF